MTLSRYFKETLKARIDQDSGVRAALLEEAVDCLLAGELDVGKSVLRDYVNSTIGFQELGALTAKSPKSLMRMLSSQGNPQARNLFEIIRLLQQREGVRLKVTATH
ncbi:MAG: transcriptional regulator [Gammaproteobacteria bacterium]|nr:transcriptional regulator [Gammaproteobacteria bacterium]